MIAISPSAIAKEIEGTRFGCYTPTKCSTRLSRGTFAQRPQRSLLLATMQSDKRSLEGVKWCLATELWDACSNAVISG